MVIPEKIKTILSSPYILIFIVMIPLFCIDTFLLKPSIKDHYLDMDLKNFKTYSWKYLLTTAAIISITLIVFMKIKQFSKIIITCILSLFLAFWSFNFLFINTILFINSQTEKSQITNTYEVINHKEVTSFWLNSGKKNSIHDDDEIELIDEKRKVKGLKSIFECKTGDTLQVKFKKGIFNVNYLE